MPEIEIFEDKSVLVGKRRKGRDETIEDAFKTMERFSDWLTDSKEKNPWLEADAMNAAMLYGMLLHLREAIDKLIALGGDDARNSYEFFAKKMEESNTLSQLPISLAHSERKSSDD